MFLFVFVFISAFLFAFVFLFVLVIEDWKVWMEKGSQLMRKAFAPTNKFKENICPQNKDSANWNILKCNLLLFPRMLKLWRLVWVPDKPWIFSPYFFFSLRSIWEISHFVSRLLISSYWLLGNAFDNFFCLFFPKIFGKKSSLICFSFRFNLEMRWFSLGIQISLSASTPQSGRKTANTKLFPKKKKR